MSSHQNALDEVQEWTAAQLSRAMRTFPNIILEVITPGCDQCDLYDKVFKQFGVVMHVMDEHIPIARVNLGTVYLIIIITM